MIKWKFDPTGYLLEEYDADQNMLASRVQTCTFTNISSYYTLDVRTRYVTLTMTAMDQRIGTLRVYSAGEPDADTTTSRSVIIATCPSVLSNASV